MPSIDISAYQKNNKPKQKAEGNYILDLLGKDISLGKAGLSDRKKEGFYNELGTLIRSGMAISDGDLSANVEEPGHRTEHVEKGKLP